MAHFSSAENEKKKKKKKNPKTVNLWILYPMTVTLRKIEETKAFS